MNQVYSHLPLLAPTQKWRRSSTDCGFRSRWKCTHWKPSATKTNLIFNLFHMCVVNVNLRVDIKLYDFHCAFSSHRPSPLSSVAVNKDEWTQWNGDAERREKSVNGQIRRTFRRLFWFLVFFRWKFRNILRVKYLHDIFRCIYYQIFIRRDEWTRYIEQQLHGQ